MTAARIGLSPQQFWDMTPREMTFAQRGYMWRSEQEQWRIAAIVAAIYDVQRNPKKRRKPITARDFMPQQKAPGAKTPEAQKAVLDGLVARTRHMTRFKHRAPV